MNLFNEPLCYPEGLRGCDTNSASGTMHLETIPAVNQESTHHSALNSSLNSSTSSDMADTKVSGMQCSNPVSGTAVFSSPEYWF